MGLKLQLPQGWMGKQSRKWLRKQVANVPRGGLVAEVGSWRGRSTLVLATHLPPEAHLYAIDTWEGTPDDPSQHEQLYANAGDVYQDFLQNLARPIMDRRLTPLRMTSLEGATALWNRHGFASFDFVFIDADHRYEAVDADIHAYRSLVRPGGILAGHDYHWEGVARAVAERLGLENVVLGPRSIWSYQVPVAA
jgi:predicted O-methyltransferase YrrM